MNKTHQTTDIRFKDDIPARPYFNIKISAILFGSNLSRLPILLPGEKPSKRARPMPTYMLHSINLSDCINLKWNQQRDNSAGRPLPLEFKRSTPPMKVRFQDLLDTLSVCPPEGMEIDSQS